MTTVWAGTSFFKRGQRPLDAIFLGEADRRVDHDDEGNEDRVLEVADDAGDHRRDHQDDDQEIAELGEEHAERTAPRLLDDRVRSMHQKPPRRLGSDRPAPGSVASRRATAFASSAWKRGATGSLAAGDGLGRSDIIGIGSDTI